MWTRLQQNGEVPATRSSHSLTSVGAQLFLFGGEQSSRTPVSSDMFSYDVHSMTWSKVAAKGTPPVPRVAHTAAAVGTSIYIFGGRTGMEMGDGAMDDLWVFDTTTSTWSQVLGATGAMPAKRSFHTMVALGQTLYFFGGCGVVDRLSDMYEFDIQACKWTCLPTPEDMKARGGSCLSASADGTCLFVMGGFNGGELDDMHRYEIATSTWTVVPPCGLPARSVFGVGLHQCSTSSCDHSGHMLAFGGEIDPSTVGHSGAGDFSDALFCYEAGQGWHPLTASGEAPCARGWFATTNLAGNMVVHGGLDCANERLGDMFQLNLHPVKVAA